MTDSQDRLDVDNEAFWNRARFQALVDSVPGIVWEADARTLQFVFVSKQAEHLLGYPVREWLEDPEFWKDHLHPEDRDWAVEHCLAATRARRPHELEYRMIAADGRAVWLRDLVSVSEEPDGTVRLRGVMVDVTDAKRADSALRHSEAQYRALARNFPNGAVALFDRDLRYTLVDGTILPEIGLSRETLEGRTIREAYDPELCRRLEPFYRRALSGETGSFELEYADRVFEIHVAPVRSPDGEVSAGLAISQDITERKAVEQELRASEARFRAMTDHMMAGVWHITPDGHTIDLNPAMCEMLEIDGAEALEDRTYHEFFTAESLERIEEEQARRARGIASAYEVEIVGQRGTRRRVLVAGAPVMGPDGELESLIGTLTDVTEIKELERQLRGAQRMEAIGQLAGGIAHDFNNLLTAVLGSADLLGRQLDPDDPGRVEVEEIRSAARRAADLTKQLLAFSRQQILTPRPLDLGEVVRSTEGMLGRLIGEHIELVTVTDSELGTVQADRAQLEQVIVNLAINARDAMPDGGRLTIEARNVAFEPAGPGPPAPMPPGRYVTLVVRDNGIGMDEETRAKIFEPFFTTKPRGKGTGLGLATVYGIVKQSGGYIFVDSEPGQGAAFTVYLPRAEVPDEPEDIERPPPEPPADGSGTILLAEDEDSVRAVAGRILEAAGYEVLAVEDGERALELLRDDPSRIDLLLTDLVMPGMDGRELAGQVRELRPDLRVVFISGYSDGEVVRDRAWRDRVVLLQKPFTPESLTRTVREVLEGSEEVGSTPP